jgi:formylglycine-generating enzyme required for sulfatase activity
MAIKIDRTTKYIQTFTEDLGGDVGLVMVLIPDGKFMMGSLSTEEGHQSRESPQHEVTISVPFFMGQYPITKAQWRRVAAMPPINQLLTLEPSSLKGDDDFPVETVSWLDAQEFCARLATHTKHRYQLPSEAEWEYACRAGTTTPFHFGETIDAQLANYRAKEKYAEGELGEDRQRTTSVGSFGVANDFGLYDMHGNVWEWCQDDCNYNYKNALGDGSAWLESKDKKDTLKILRGGSWLNFPDGCRSACRLRDFTDAKNNSFGFRVARTF